MLLTKDTIRKLIVEELKNLNGKEQLTEGNKALAAFLASAIIANPALANKAREAGVTSDLKDLGIDLAALAEPTAKEKAAKEKAIELKAKKGGPSVRTLKVGQPVGSAGPLVQKVPEFNGVSIVELLNKIAEKPLGKAAMANVGLVDTIRGYDPKLNPKFDALVVKYRDMVVDAANEIKKDREVKAQKQYPGKTIKPSLKKAIKPTKAIKEEVSK